MPPLPVMLVPDLLRANMMRFVTSFIAVLSLGFLLIPAVASMQADPYGFIAAAPASLKNGVAGSKSVEGVVGNVISIALSLIGIIFFLLIVYAGLNWMIARGNTEQVDKSKNMIEGAVIGLIIVLAAYAITKFVFESLDTGGAQPTPTTEKRCVEDLVGACSTRAECEALAPDVQIIEGTCSEAGKVCCK